MTAVNVTESILMSSCFKCDKVFSLVDQLSKSMQEFEVFTKEMTFDLKSAKTKSTQVLSNVILFICIFVSFCFLCPFQFWQLISTIQSLKIQVGGKAEVEKDLGENQTSARTFVGVEQSEGQSQSASFENEKAPAKSKSNPFDQMSKTRSREFPSPNFKSNPKPDFNIAAKRANEIKRSKTLLRTIKCETRDGFYNLFECVKCQRQFSKLYNGLNHVQNIHLSLGEPCPTCFIKFFTKTSLELHIPKCKKKKQLKNIKVWLQKDSKKPVKVHLHPHPKQKQGQASSTRNRNQHRNQKSGKKVQNQRGKQKKNFNPLKVKVRNPFPSFSLEKAMNVKVVIERLKTEKSEETSIISQIQTNANEEIKIGTAKGKGNEFI